MTRTSNFAHLLDAVKKETAGKKDYTDDTFYKLDPDAAGNASTLIRFLPSKDPTQLPFVKYWSYSFKNQANGRWFIENCPFTLGLPSPLMEFNGILWNEVGTEEAKAQARRQRRTLNYVANILIVNDPKNPSLNGKVFKYRFGKKIFDKIAEKVQGNDLDSPVNVFDLQEGCNFKLRMKKIAVAGQKAQANYDSSEWDSQSSIVSNDDQAQALLAKTHDIQYLVAPSSFKDYDTLKKRLEYVLGAVQQTENAESMQSLVADVAPSVSNQVAAEEAKVLSGIPTEFDEDVPAIPPAPRKPILNLNTDDDDDGDEEDYFAKLANM